MFDEHPYAEIAKRLWLAVADGDSEALREVLAPDIVWRSIGTSPISGEYRGPEEVMEYLATIGETADEFSTSLDGIYIGGDGAVVLHHAEGRRGDKKLKMDYFLRLRIEDEWIVDVLNVPVDQRRNDTFWG